MAWDFTVDSDIQLEMASILKDKADELDKQFADLYTQIGPGNLGTHWVGSDYDAFNTGCLGYKQALSDMTDSVRMYANHFEKVAEGTDLLANDCIVIVQNMTTRGDALPGSGNANNGNTTNGTTNNTNNTNNNTNNNAQGGGTTNNNNNTNNNNSTNKNNNNNNNSTNNNNNNNSTNNNNNGYGKGNAGGVTGVWKSYQDAADAGYPNIRTEREFARGGYDKDKYGTYDNYLAAMQERYVGSTYDQDTKNGYGKGNAGGPTTNNNNNNGVNPNNQGGSGNTSNNTNNNNTNNTNNQNANNSKGSAGWTVAGAVTGGLVGGIPGAIVGGIAGNAVGKADEGTKWGVGAGAAGYLFGGLPGAVTGFVAGKTINGLKTGEFETAFQTKEIYKTMGEDFANNFDYSNCDGLVDGAIETASGLLKTGADTIQHGMNIAYDTVNTGIDAIQYSLLGRDKDYWSTRGEDFANNFDYSNCDGLIDGAIETVSGIGKTAWDIGETAVNGIVDGAQAVGDFCQDVWNFIF